MFWALYIWKASWWYTYIAKSCPLIKKPSQWGSLCCVWVGRGRWYLPLCGELWPQRCEVWAVLLWYCYSVSVMSHLLREQRERESNSSNTVLKNAVIKTPLGFVLSDFALSVCLSICLSVCLSVCQLNNGCFIYLRWITSVK